MLENLSIGTQLLLLAGLLVVLFLTVRFNNIHNRKKRLGKKGFGARLKENRKEREQEED